MIILYYALTLLRIRLDVLWSRRHLACSGTLRSYNQYDSSFPAQQSSPRALVQVVIVGAQILGKAFLEAGRQAARSELFV
jgi:hypothetical protein